MPIGAAATAAAVEWQRRFLAARVAIFSAVSFLVLLGALHILEPEFDPSWRVVSEYSLGRFGLLMNFAFLALATSYLATALALRPHLRPVARGFTLGMLLLSASGALLAALFDTDPVTTADRTTSGRLHELGATLDLVPMAAALVCVRLWRSSEWRSTRQALLATTIAIWVANAALIAALVAYLPAGGPPLGPEVLIGWPGRAVLVSYSGWVIVVARIASRLALRSAG